MIFNFSDSIAIINDVCSKLLVNNIYKNIRQAGFNTQFIDLKPDKIKDPEGGTKKINDFYQFFIKSLWHHYIVIQNSTI